MISTPRSSIRGVLWPAVVTGQGSALLSLAFQLERSQWWTAEERAVRTYGEPLTQATRAACREAWGVPVQDVYSCEELGMIALQCPEHEHLHVQSEAVLVEVLDEEGNPCAPGQIGRVVLTALHSFAMPLLRYAIGDHAEVGAPCPCGRGLPVLKRIAGRRRDQVVLPDGRRTWPDVDALWEAIPGAEQIQAVQRDEDHVEVRYARERLLLRAEEEAATARVHEALGHAFRLTFHGQDAIPRQPNGKYPTFSNSLDDRTRDSVFPAKGGVSMSSKDSNVQAAIKQLALKVEDLATFETSIRALVRSPWCRVCGDASGSYHGRAT